MLPVAAVPELLEATAAGQAVLRVPPKGGRLKRLVYAPELIPVGTVAPAAQDSNTRQPELPQSSSGVTDRLPILMYHSVAPEGDPNASRYRITPDVFEEQLRYLRDAGYRSVGLEEWRIAMRAERPLPGRAVLLTFDDGYLDFQTQAWPLLERYGFSATLSVVADDVGKSNRWDQARSGKLPMLSWTQLRYLQSRGIEIASHSSSHTPLSDLSPADIVREAVRSRVLLERELGRPIKTFMYPYGIFDEAVEHLIGACGYIFGLTCEFKLSGFFDPLLALPRIEITGSDTLQDFVRKIVPVSSYLFRHPRCEGVEKGS